MKTRNVRHKQWLRWDRRAMAHHKWSRKFAKSQLLHDAIKPTLWWGRLSRY